MRRLRTIMGLDMTNALRDNIVAYMLIAPLLMALAVRFFFPSVEASGQNFAVEQNVGQSIIVSLEKYGQVEVYPNAQEVQSRIERNDSVPGVVISDGQVSLLLEGNEPLSVVRNAQAIIGKVLAGQNLVSVTQRHVGGERSLLYEYLVIGLMMMSIFLGAMIPGFNLIHEKETKAVRALNVSPLTTADYVAARGFLATLISVVTVSSASLILMGTSINYAHLIIGLLLSGLLTTLLALMVGVMADNQITAIAVLKVSTPLYMFIPFISLFVPAKFKPLFYPLPNYWQLQMLRSIYIGEGSYWPAAGLTLATSVILFLMLLPALKRKLRLR